MQTKSLVNLFLSGFALLIIFLTSCKFQSEYNDEPSQRDKAVKVADEFYELLKAGKYSDLERMFSPKFFAKTDTATLYKIFNAVKNKLGDYQSKNLDSWKTYRTKGTNADFAGFMLIYKVRYTNNPSTESLTMEDSGNGIQVIGYYVDSPAFLE